MELAVNSKVTFFEETHSYVCGKKVLIGVTSLMKKHGLSADYSGVSEETLAHAAEIGTMAHRLLEQYDNKESVVQNSLIKSYAKLGLNVIASEYLISDNKVIASSIDKVIEVDETTVDLADVKRTSSLHKDALAWQLGIYKYLFELQNPGIKVRDCYCIHIKKGNEDDVEKDTIKSYTKIEPVDAKEVKKLIACEKKGELYEAPEKAGTKVSKVIAKDKLATLGMAVANIAAFDAMKKVEEEKIAGIREELYEWMLENGKDELTGDGFTVKLKKPYNTTRIDTAGLRAAHPDIADKFSVTSTTKGSISFTINK